MGGGSVGVAGDDGFQVEKHVLGFGTCGIGGEHCQCCFHFSVECRLCGIVAYGGFVVVEFREVAHQVAASAVERRHEKRCDAASPILRQPPAILEGVTASYGIFKPCHSALIGRFAVVHKLLVV